MKLTHNWLKDPTLANQTDLSYSISRKGLVHVKAALSETIQLPPQTSNRLRGEKCGYCQTKMAL